MKIVSDFKDSYDAAMGYGGFDDYPLFIRMSGKGVSVNHKDAPQELHGIYSSHHIYSGVCPTSFRVLLFCGKAYPFVTLNASYNSGNIKGDHFFTDSTYISSDW